MPLTIPIRAQVSCTATIKGKVNNAVQRVAKPNPAPATAYVAIPEGSWSDAPVINPGPSNFKKRFTGFFSCTTAASSEAVPPADSAWRITGGESSDGFG